MSRWLPVTVLVFIAAAWPGAAAQARLWTDSSGVYRVEATFVEQLGDGGVRLLRADNQTIVTVPLERLSPDDRQFVERIKQQIRACHGLAAEVACGREGHLDGPGD